MKRILTLINWGLTPVVIYLGVSLFYQILDPPTLPMVKAVKDGNGVLNASPKVSLPIDAYQSIVSRNIFRSGTLPTKAEPELTMDVTDLKQTDLKLKLWGTITGAADTAYAVIEDGVERSQDLYRVGDRVQNATIKLILREKVVLNVQGRDEVLVMEKAVGPKTGYPNRMAERMTSGRGNRKVQIRRSQIDNALKNLSQLMTQVRVRPHFDRGKPDGLVLRSIKYGSIFQKLGLRNGDVLNGVDGNEIKTVDDAMKLVDDLKAASRVNLQIKRRGREQIIECMIN